MIVCPFEPLYFFCWLVVNCRQGSSDCCWSGYTGASRKAFTPVDEVQLVSNVEDMIVKHQAGDLEATEGRVNNLDIKLALDSASSSSLNLTVAGLSGDKHVRDCDDLGEKVKSVDYPLDISIEGSQAAGASLIFTEEAPVMATTGQLVSRGSSEEQVAKIGTWGQICDVIADEAGTTLFGMRGYVPETVGDELTPTRGGAIASLRLDEHVAPIQRTQEGMYLEGDLELSEPKAQDNDSALCIVSPLEEAYTQFDDDQASSIRLRSSKKVGPSAVGVSGEEGELYQEILGQSEQVGLHLVDAVSTCLDKQEQHILEVTIAESSQAGHRIAVVVKPSDAVQGEEGEHHQEMLGRDEQDRLQNVDDVSTFLDKQDQHMLEAIIAGASQAGERQGVVVEPSAVGETEGNCHEEVLGRDEQVRLRHVDDAFTPLDKENEHILESTNAGSSEAGDGVLVVEPSAVETSENGGEHHQEMLGRDDQVGLPHVEDASICLDKQDLHIHEVLIAESSHQEMLGRDEQVWSHHYDAFTSLDKHDQHLLESTVVGASQGEDGVVVVVEPSAAETSEEECEHHREVLAQDELVGLRHVDDPSVCLDKQGQHIHEDTVLESSRFGVGVASVVEPSEAISGEDGEHHQDMLGQDEQVRLQHVYDAPTSPDKQDLHILEAIVDGASQAGDQLAVAVVEPATVGETEGKRPEEMLGRDEQAGLQHVGNASTCLDNQDQHIYEVTVAESSQAGDGIVVVVEPSTLEFSENEGESHQEILGQDEQVGSQHVDDSSTNLDKQDQHIHEVIAVKSSQAGGDGVAAVVEPSAEEFSEKECEHHQEMLGRVEQVGSQHVDDSFRYLDKQGQPIHDVIAVESSPAGGDGVAAVVEPSAEEFSKKEGEHHQEMLGRDEQVESQYVDDSSTCLDKEDQHIHDVTAVESPQPGDGVVAVVEPSAVQFSKTEGEHHQEMLGRDEQVGSQHIDGLSTCVDIQDQHIHEVTAVESAQAGGDGVAVVVEPSAEEFSAKEDEHHQEMSQDEQVGSQQVGDASTCLDKEDQHSHEATVAGASQAGDGVRVVVEPSALEISEKEGEDQQAMLGRDEQVGLQQVDDASTCLDKQDQCIHEAIVAGSCQPGDAVVVDPSPDLKVYVRRRKRSSPSELTTRDPDSHLGTLTNNSHQCVNEGSTKLVDAGPLEVKGGDTPPERVVKHYVRRPHRQTDVLKSAVAAAATEAAKEASKPVVSTFRDGGKENAFSLGALHDKCMPAQFAVKDKLQTPHTEKHAFGNDDKLHSAKKETVSERGYRRLGEQPDWLPEGWTLEVRVREGGSTAGSRDKYYHDPKSGHRFRSKNEVLQFLEYGKLVKWQLKSHGTDTKTPSQNKKRVSVRNTLDKHSAVQSAPAKVFLSTDTRPSSLTTAKLPLTHPYARMKSTPMKANPVTLPGANGVDSPAPPVTWAHVDGPNGPIWLPWGGAMMGQEKQSPVAVHGTAAGASALGEGASAMRLSSVGDAVHQPTSGSVVAGETPNDQREQENRGKLIFRLKRKHPDPEAGKGRSKRPVYEVVHGEKASSSMSTPIPQVKKVVPGEGTGHEVRSASVSIHREQQPPMKELFSTDASQFLPKKLTGQAPEEQLKVSSIKDRNENPLVRSVPTESTDNALLEQPPVKKARFENYSITNWSGEQYPLHYLPQQSRSSQNTQGYPSQQSGLSQSSLQYFSAQPGPFQNPQQPGLLQNPQKYTLQQPGPPKTPPTHFSQQLGPIHNAPQYFSQQPGPSQEEPYIALGIPATASASGLQQMAPFGANHMHIFMHSIENTIPMSWQFPFSSQAPKPLPGPVPNLGPFPSLITPSVSGTYSSAGAVPIPVFEHFPGTAPSRHLNINSSFFPGSETGICNRTVDPAIIPKAVEVVSQPHKIIVPKALTKVENSKLLEGLGRRLCQRGADQKSRNSSLSPEEVTTTMEGPNSFFVSQRLVSSQEGSIVQTPQNFVNR